MSKFLLRTLPLAAAAGRLAGRVAAAGEMRPGRPTLLCFNRAVLASDLVALQERADLNLLTLRAAEFEALLARYAPKRARVQTYFARAYAEGDAALRDRLKAATRLFLDAVAAKTPFDAIVVGNSDYWQDVPLIEVAAERGAPFVVLCRENYAVPETQEWLADHLARSGWTFAGSGVAVASDITRDFFVSSKAYKPGDVRTTGWPRFDSWFAPNPYPAEARDLIVMVSYHEPLYGGPENYGEALKAFMAAARASGASHRFVLKLKKISHLTPILRRCPGLLTSGVRIVSKQRLDDLLRRSRMVIGYNTTGVLEAYLTDTAVVVPWWKDAVRPAVDTLISAETPDDRATTYFPGSPDALRALIEQAVAAPLPLKGAPEERLSRFTQFVAFDPDETASARFEAFVRELIAARRDGGEG